MISDRCMHGVSRLLPRRRAPWAELRSDRSRSARSSGEPRARPPCGPRPPRRRPVAASTPLARNAATMPVSTSPVPAVARAGSPPTTRSPRPGLAHQGAGALQQDDADEPLDCAIERREPMCVDPVRLDVEQPGELARVRRKDARRRPVRGLELVESVAVDHCGHLCLRQDTPDELLRALAAAEARARSRALRLCLRGRARRPPRPPSAARRRPPAAAA